MGKYLRIYISKEVSPTVAKSQMINWAKVLQVDGIDTLFVIYYVRTNKLISVFEGSNIAVTFRKNSNINLVSTIIVTISLIKLYFSNKNNYQKIIIQTRTQSVAFTFLILRIFFPTIYLVADIRGSRENDYDYLLNINLRQKIREYFLDFKEAVLLKSSNKILVVSQKLGSYLTYKHRIEVNSKISVIYGAADSEFFNYDVGRRRRVRTILGLNDRKVFIYSGMLDKMWQIPKQIYDLFSIISHVDSSAYFIIATPNVDIANRLLSNYKIEKKKYQNC